MNFLDCWSWTYENSVHSLCGCGALAETLYIILEYLTVGVSRKYPYPTMGGMNKFNPLTFANSQMFHSPPMSSEFPPPFQIFVCLFVCFLTFTIWNPSLTPYDFQSKRFCTFTSSQRFTNCLQCLKLQEIFMIKCICDLMFSDFLLFSVNFVASARLN